MIMLKKSRFIINLKCCIFITQSINTMKKLIIILTLLISVSAINAQNPFGMRGVFGIATIDDKVWAQFALRPTIDVWKIKMGFDIVLYIDQDGKIHKDEWDFSDGRAIKNTLLDKIYFIQYGTEHEPVYVRAGALERTTLGYGILVNRYSNTFNYPQFRKIGLDAKFQSKSFSAHVFVNNFKENASVVGGRISSKIPMGLHFGLSAVTDQNQYLGLHDSDYDGRPDIVDSFPNDENSWLDSDDDGLADDDPNEIDRDGDGIPDVYNLEEIIKYWDATNLPDEYKDSTLYSKIPDKNIVLKDEPLNINNNPKPISAVAVDIAMPIFQTEATSLSIYSQAAHMIGETVDPLTQEKVELRYGFAPAGVHNHIGFFTWQVEYRIIPDGGFDFEYWDRAYEHTRATVASIDNTDIASLDVKPKSDYLGEIGAMRGIYGRIDFDISEKVLIGAMYQNMLGDMWNSESGKFESGNLESFLASAELIQETGYLQSASAFYQQRNVPNPFKFEPSENTIMGFSVGVKIGWGMILNYSFKRSFLDKNGDGDVLDDNEAINISLLETSFGF